MSNTPTSHPSTWIIHLKAGEAEGLEALWERFYERLVTHAKGRIQHSGVPTIDEEAVTCSVFESIWRAASQGRLNTIESTDELWWWLLRTAQRKVVNHARYESAEKRGKKVHVASINDANGLRDFLSVDPDPEYLAILAEEYELAISALGDQQLKQIAVMRLAGATHSEIVQQLDVAPATVTRKLRRIYEIWAARGEA